MKTAYENTEQNPLPRPDETMPAPLPALLGEDGAFAPEWYGRFEELQPYAATLAKFRRPEALAKSYARLERLKGYPDPQDAARMAAFREAVGLPAEPGQFCMARPEDTPDEIWDERLAGELARVAYEYGVPARAMEELSARYAAEGRQALAAMQRAQQEAIEQADAELQRDWGRQYEQNMGMLSSYMQELGARAGVDVQALADNPALRANADFAKLMLAAAAQQQEAPLHRGEPADGRGEAHRIAHDPTHPLHEAYMRTNHPQHRYANEQYDRFAFGRRL